MGRTTGWSVFPNPSNGTLMLRAGEYAQEARLELLDQQGRVVWGRSMSNLVAGAVLDVTAGSAPAPGSYVLSIITATTYQRVPVILH